MSHTIIVGAGLAGISVAFELRETLGEDHPITLISPEAYFQFVPSNPWVAVGWRERGEVTEPLGKQLAKKKIDLVLGSAESIDPARNEITVSGGEVLDYDYLVLATGPELAFDEIPGLGPEQGHTQSICSLDHALKAWEKYQAFLAKPGPIVIGAVQGASCFGPAYEFALILDADLRKKKLRDQVPMTFVTSEPYIGHMGLGGVGDSRGMMESELRQRHIKWMTNAKVDHVDDGAVTVVRHDDEGKPIETLTVPFSFSMFLPAFRGVPAVRNVTDICNPRGFVVVDEHQRNPTYPNIYGAGVGIAIPPVEVTPIPTGAPKTGYMIESMVTAISHNIKADIAGHPPEATGTWNAICLADMGDTGIAFVALPQFPPRNVTWAKKGKWVHLAKIGFEKYFLRKVRKGITTTVYETFILKQLGITKLRKT